MANLETLLNSRDVVIQTASREDQIAYHLKIRERRLTTKKTVIRRARKPAVKKTKPSSLSKVEAILSKLSEEELAEVLKNLNIEL